MKKILTIILSLVIVVAQSQTDTITLSLSACCQTQQPIGCTNCSTYKISTWNGFISPGPLAFVSDFGNGAIFSHSGLDVDYNGNDIAGCVDFTIDYGAPDCTGNQVVTYTNALCGSTGLDLTAIPNFEYCNLSIGDVLQVTFSFTSDSGLQYSQVNGVEVGDNAIVSVGDYLTDADLQPFACDATSGAAMFSGTLLQTNEIGDANVTLFWNGTQGATFTGNWNSSTDASNLLEGVNVFTASGIGISNPTGNTLTHSFINEFIVECNDN